MLGAAHRAYGVNEGPGERKFLKQYGREGVQGVSGVYSELVLQ